MTIKQLLASISIVLLSGGCDNSAKQNNNQSANGKDDIFAVSRNDICRAPRPATSKKQIPVAPIMTAEILHGRAIFNANCSVCHGENAVGQTPEWEKPLANGRFPAPPLNGSGHAAHHSKIELLAAINNGSVDSGGIMPAFKNRLSENDKQAVLSYLFSLWPKQTYNSWLQAHAEHSQP